MSSEEQQATKTTTEDKTSAPDPSASSGIIGSAKNLLANLTSGSSKDNTKDEKSNGSSSFVSALANKVTGANKGTSNNYKKATDYESTESDKGNVIKPNDNKNVKYSSMVDSVVNDDEAIKSDLRSEGEKAKAATEEKSTDGSSSGTSDLNDQVAKVPGL